MAKRKPVRLMNAAEQADWIMEWPHAMPLREWNKRARGRLLRVLRRAQKIAAAHQSLLAMGDSRGWWGH